MDINPHREKIYKICKSIVKYSPDEDHRDLAHDIFAKLIPMDAPSNMRDSWLLTVCHNQWRDRCKYKNYRRDEGHLFNMISAWYLTEYNEDPDIELLAKEMNIDLDNWPVAYKPNNPQRLSLWEAINRT